MTSPTPEHDMSDSATLLYAKLKEASETFATLRQEPSFSTVELDELVDLAARSRDNANWLRAQRDKAESHLAASPPSETDTAKSIECCVQCGEPKEPRNQKAGDEVANGWPRCVNPSCVAFNEPVASAWYRAEHKHECQHGHPHEGRCECVCGYVALSASKPGGPEDWHGEIRSNAPLVRCEACGQTCLITNSDIASYMAQGWPQHCGATMTYVPNSIE